MPLKVREILVPVDFSPQSRAALRYALAFAERFEARLVLVHIAEEIVYPADWSYTGVPIYPNNAERTTDLLARVRTFAGALAEKITPVVRVGRPWQQIVEIAKERKSDLIITATHGHTGLKHALLGSVAEKVVRHAHCPVLTVRRD